MRIILLRLLKKRFDNPHATVNVYLQAFIDIPCAKSHSAQDLKIIWNKADCVIELKQTCRGRTCIRDDLIVFISVSKLDKITRRDWKLSLGNDTELPNFSTLENFLTSRICVLESMELTSKPTQVSLFDFDETLHTSRAMKNNRYVFFYIGGNSVLRLETTF